MRVGVLGGGQLGAMLGLAGFPLGIECTYLDPNPDSPAFKVGKSICDEYSVASVSSLAAQTDLLTFEFENVPGEVLLELENSTVAPPVRALRISQDRLVEKNFLHSLGIATAPFIEVDTSLAVIEGLKKIRCQSGIVKSRRFGYDGKSQLRVDNSISEHDSDLISLLKNPCILEGLVDFRRELSQISVRSRDGEIVHFPLTENLHEKGILRASFSPPRNEVDEQHVNSARHYTEKILEELQYVGTVAIELFETTSGLVANELAPRVHNSGHWTIDGCSISQFEAHLRAICDLPLCEPRALGHSCMINILGTYPSDLSWLKSPYVKLHNYHKEERSGRKIGHINVCAPTKGDLMEILSTLSVPKPHNMGVG